MICAQIREKLELFRACVETDSGAQIRTQCLYPSYDPVFVYVAGFGEGFKIHDGAGAAKVSWAHAREGGLVTKALGNAAKRFGIDAVEDQYLTVTVDTSDWLINAILAVANASSSAAYDAVSHSVKAVEEKLQERIYNVLSDNFKEKQIVTEYPFIGNSGREYRFDFAITDSSNDNVILLDAVMPHRNSVAAHYVAFSDVHDSVRNGRFAIYDRPLAREDKTLLHQVATVISFDSLMPGLEKVLSRV